MLEDILNELGVISRRDRDNLLEEQVDIPTREEYVPWKPTYNGEQPPF